MKIREAATGKEIEIPDAQAGEFAARGGYDFAPGAAIPVSHEDGTVSAVPVEQYWQQRNLYRPASAQEVEGHLAKAQEAANAAVDAQKEAEFGEGAANIARAGAEAVARGVTLGGSDWVMTQMGADPTGIKERQERNPIAAGVGEVAGAIAPLVLTGGASAVEQVGAKGALALAARATPAVIADRIGAAVGAKVAGELGAGFTARLASGTANMAVQGALAGVGGEISARALSGRELLDPATMDEYLMAAGQGAAIGGVLGAGGHLIGEAAGAGLALGGKAVAAGKRLYGELDTAMKAPLRAADAEVAAAEARLRSIGGPDVSAEEQALAAARAQAEAVAPQTELLPGAMGGRADVPLDQVGRDVPYVYHAVPESKFGAIAESGLDPSKSVSEPRGTYFSKDQEGAQYWSDLVGEDAGERAVTLRTLQSPDIAPNTVIKDIEGRAAPYMTTAQKVEPHRLEYWDASANKWQKLTEGSRVGGAPSQDAFAQLGKRVRSEAEALGIEPAAAKSAWERIEKGRETFNTIDASTDASTRKIAASLDEFEHLTSNALEDVSMARRNDAMRQVLAKDRTAADPVQFVDALKQQHDKLRAIAGEFRGDADSKIASYAQKLDKYLKQQDGEMAALGRNAEDRAAAFEILDQSNRVLGLVRGGLGERGALGIRTMSEALSGAYEETRQLLKNPMIVGESVAELTGKAKGAWTNLFDVNAGFRRGLLAENMGGARTRSGFGTVARADPAKIGGLLKNVDAPATQLQLEVTGRAIDARIQLLKHFKEDLKLGSEVEAQITRAIKVAEDLADEIVAHRSRVALAKEYASNVAPAMKEISEREGALLRAREKATANLAKQREGAERALEKATERQTAAQERMQGGLGSAILESVMAGAGGIAGGAVGMIGGQMLARMAGSAATPILRHLGAAGLQGAIKTGEMMGQLRKVAQVGQRLQAATVAIGDALRTAKPLAGAAKVIAMEARRDTEEAYDAATADVIERAESDPRAAYLASVMPVTRQPLSMRPDLVKTGGVTPLEQRRFMRSVRAANDPVSVVEAFAAGAGTREGAAALRTLYPQLYQRAVADIFDHTAQLKKAPSMSAQRHLSILVGQPLHFTVSPDFVKFTQGVYGGANATGQGSTDMLQDSSPGGRARQINSKVSQSMATPGQRLENGVQ